MALKARPFLKWAGGKSRLTGRLSEFIPHGKYRHYFEPFLGSAAMYFAISPQKGKLNDMNAALISCYKDVKSHCEDLIDILESLQDEYRDNLDIEAKREYYLARRAEYNQGASGVRRSALFVFLNKTGFNGMYRENSRGEFNIPFGKHQNPLICDKDNLRLVSNDLKDIELSSGDYATALQDAKKGDFVFLDPPYEPISATSNFTQYVAGGFSDQNQRDVYDIIHKLSKKGCFVMMTNSTGELTTSLYSRNSKFSVHTIEVSRSINSKAKGRGKVKEYVILNYDLRSWEILC